MEWLGAYYIHVHGTVPSWYLILLTFCSISSLLFGGFFISNDDIYVWLSWLRYLSFIKYGFAGQYRAWAFESWSVSKSFPQSHLLSFFNQLCFKLNMRIATCQLQNALWLAPFARWTAMLLLRTVCSSTLLALALLAAYFLALILASLPGTIHLRRS